MGSLDDTTQSFKIAKKHWTRYRSGKLWRIKGRLQKLRVSLKIATRTLHEAPSFTESSMWESDWESEITSDRGSSMTNFASLDSHSGDFAHDTGRVRDRLQAVDIAREPGFWPSEIRGPENNVEIFESRLSNVVPSSADFENTSESSGDIANAVDVSVHGQQPSSACVESLSANLGCYLDTVNPVALVLRPPPALLRPIREADSEISETVLGGSESSDYPRNISEFGRVLQVPTRYGVARRRLVLQYNLRSLHAG